MSKSRKIRAFEMAGRCSLSFKEFAKHAEALGHAFPSAQNSLSEELAVALVEAVQRRIEEQEMTKKAAKKKIVPAATPEPVVAKKKENPPTNGASTPKGAATNATKKAVESGASAKEQVVVSSTPVEPVEEAKVSEKSSKSTAAKATVAAKAPTHVEVCFSFRHDRTLPGDTVCISGSLPELGQWEPTQALKLVWNEGSEWKSTVKLPFGSAFEYKLLVCNEHGCFWEEGENRQFLISSQGGETTVEGEFR